MRDGSGAPERPAGRESTPELTRVVDELEGTLAEAGRLLKALQAAVPPPPPKEDPAAEQVARLQRDLDTAELDLSEFSTRLIETENQRSRLMNLYVATYQLHATLDLEEVTSTIAEISRELLGAQKYVLLLRNESEDQVCEVSLAGGLDERDHLFLGRTYTGGEPTVDGTLADGVLRVDPEAGSNVLAAVPLTVQGAIVGALAILKLFDHKPALTAGDRDLLDLLAAHAASALLAARIYSATDRKLKTLENLVKLVR
ncbi:MAG: GAF domain-containing protein [Acidobacteriota bacterium]|nr:GAF domain-containing protein [Acidobacteriota bacterium]